MLALASLLISFSVPRPPALDPDRMLWAIEQVENTPRAKIGSKGERSPYQFKRITWEQHSTAPFHWASSERPVARAESDRVARAHLAFIRRELTRAGFPDSPWLCALAWKAGTTAAQTKRVSHHDLDYANRARNLYEDEPCITTRSGT